MDNLREAWVLRDEDNGLFLCANRALIPAASTHTWIGEVNLALKFFDQVSAENMISAFLSRSTAIVAKRVYV